MMDSGAKFQAVTVRKTASYSDIVNNRENIRDLDIKPNQICSNPNLKLILV